VACSLAATSARLRVFFHVFVDDKRETECSAAPKRARLRSAVALYWCAPLIWIGCCAVAFILAANVHALSNIPRPRLMSSRPRRGPRRLRRAVVAVRAPKNIHFCLDDAGGGGKFNGHGHAQRRRSGCWVRRDRESCARHRGSRPCDKEASSLSHVVLISIPLIAA